MSQLGQFSSRYVYARITAAKHLLRYIKGTLDVGLLFHNHSTPSCQLSGCADADYANDIERHRSTGGHTIPIGGSKVCWRSRCQRSVALSTTEAKYMAMGAKHLIWFWRLLYILTMESIPTTPIRMLATTILNNNNGAVFLSKEAVVNFWSKHIDIRHHFIRDLVEAGVIVPAMIDTKAMPADYLTKPANRILLERCRILGGYIRQCEFPSTSS